MKREKTTVTRTVPEKSEEIDSVHNADETGGRNASPYVANTFGIRDVKKERLSDKSGLFRLIQGR